MDERVDALPYHGYSEVPERQRGLRDGLLAVLRKYDLDIPIRQGENGAPSTLTRKFALTGIPWTELSQAKWFLCRMADDRRAGIPTNIFAIADLNYRDSAHTGQALTHNPKGLLDIDGSDRVLFPKASYFAVAHMITLFDDGVRTTGNPATSALPGIEPACFQRDSAAQVLVWKGDKRPGDSLATTPVTVALENLSFRDPVLLDPLSGFVYLLKKDCMKRQGATTILHDLPVRDSPIIVLERERIILEPKE